MQVLAAAGQHQVLIFVHSRKETAKTAKYLKEEALREDKLAKFMGVSSFHSHHPNLTSHRHPGPFQQCSILMCHSIHMWMSNDEFTYSKTSVFQKEPPSH